jgi:predicted transglutaminase-like cysteine proteinase
MLNSLRILKYASCFSFILSGHLAAHALGDGTSTHAPVPFYAFCERYPGQCQATGSGRVALSPQRMAQMQTVNERVNAAIQPRTQADYSSWDLGATSGDCNDYAVEKRRQLISLGWPSRALSLSVAVTGWGQGHLVLTVRTDQGDYVLDNMRGSIMLAHDTGYTWVKRQSASNPKVWVNVQSGRSQEAYASLPELAGASQVASAPRIKRAASGKLRQWSDVSLKDQQRVIELWNR